MFLYVRCDGSISVVEDNISVLDMVCVLKKTLKIVKIAGTEFLQLVVDEGKLYWVPIKTSESVRYQNGRVHL